MHNGIRQIFGYAKKQVVDAIETCLENNKVVKFSPMETYFQLDGESKAVLTIFPVSLGAKYFSESKHSAITYKYQYGYGFNPSRLYDAEIAIDDMSMDEIYELIKRM